jgi:hypothetical protein
MNIRVYDEILEKAESDVAADGPQFAPTLAKFADFAPGR